MAIRIEAIGPRRGLRRRVAGALRHRPAAGSLAALGVFVAFAYALSCWEFPFAAAGDVIEKGDGWPTHWRVVRAGAGGES